MHAASAGRAVAGVRRNVCASVFCAFTAPAAKPQPPAQLRYPLVMRAFMLKAAPLGQTRHLAQGLRTAFLSDGPVYRRRSERRSPYLRSASLADLSSGLFGGARTSLGRFLSRNVVASGA